MRINVKQFYAGVEATGDDMVTIGAVGGVLHLSPEYPIGGDGGGGGQGGSPLGKNAKAAGGASAAGGGGGGKKKEWFGISFLSDDASRAQAQPEGEGEGQEEPVGNGFRLIEDRTALASSSSLASASWWRGVVEGKGKAVGEAAGQGAMGAVLVLLGGGIVLMLMRWRRRGPWSPRMPR